MADRQRDAPTVLVVHESGAACADAVAAFVTGSVRIVLSDSELEHLPDALAAAAQGFAVVSARVVDAAQVVAGLSVPERHLLALVAGGATNEDMAAELGCSTASVKRGITDLCDRLAVQGRSGLIEAARALGFQ